MLISVPQLGLLPKQLVDLSLHGLGSSSTECSTNVSLPALKVRHKSAIKSSNSETRVNVGVCVCVNRVLAALAVPALAMLMGYKLIVDSENHINNCDNKAR